jgi:uncharacterized protein YbaR (Trm112 family)
MHIVDYQDGRQHLIGPTDSTHRFQFHTLEELRALFQRFGFTVERLQSDPHYVFTLRLHREPTGVGKGAPPSSETHSFACPDCRHPLEERKGSLQCTGCQTEFARRNNVPVLLPRRLQTARLDLAAASFPAPQEALA